jgi:hypothetical protein
MTTQTYVPGVPGPVTRPLTDDAGDSPGPTPALEPADLPFRGLTAADVACFVPKIIA